MFERGPGGRLHIPTHRDGCYYSRPSDCCLLCLLRIGMSSMSPVKKRLTEARRLPKHDLVGESVVVPTVGDPTTDTPYEYVEGTVSSVHTLSGESPDIVSIELETGPTVHLDLSHAVAAASV